jgi:hypothetical protein
VEPVSGFFVSLFKGRDKGEAEKGEAADKQDSTKDVGPTQNQ